MQQMETVIKIIGGNWENMDQAIIPVITKVKPIVKGEDDEYGFDIDVVKNNLREVFAQALDNYVKEQNLPQSRIEFI